MITEDYVSYKTAKLLKEKGFENDAISCINVFKGHIYKIQDRVIDADDDVTIPTLQMARKWLREKHNIHIEIRITNHSMSDMINIVKYYWVMTNTKTGRWCDESTVYTVKAFDKSEEAEEDAIRHALEKHI
jgi:hypothetical protein